MADSAFDEGIVINRFVLLLMVAALCSVLLPLPMGLFTLPALKTMLFKECIPLCVGESLVSFEADTHEMVGVGGINIDLQRNGGCVW